MTESLVTDVSIGEWTTARLAGVHLTSSDRAIADRLRQSRQLEILDLHEGLRVESRGWIVHRVCSTWDELCQDDTAEDLVRPVITRTNSHYRHALELAYLLDGRTLTRKIADKKNFEGVNAGDQIDITYSQALLIAAEAAKK